MTVAPNGLAIWGRIQRLENFAKQLTEQWLRSAGWKHTSQTIGSYWKWEKEIDGKIYVMSTEEAARIQRNIDVAADAEAYPETYED